MSKIKKYWYGRFYVRTVPRENGRTKLKIILLSVLRNDTKLAATSPLLVVDSKQSVVVKAVAMSNTNLDTVFDFAIPEDAAQVAQAAVNWISSFVPTNNVVEAAERRGEELPLLTNVGSETSDISYQSTLVSNKVEIMESTTPETEVTESFMETLAEKVSDYFFVDNDDDDLRIQIDDEVRTDVDGEISAERDIVATEIEDPMEVILALKKDIEVIMEAKDLLFYALTRVIEKTRMLELKVHFYEERNSDDMWFETLSEDLQAALKKELKVVISGEEYRNDGSVDSHETSTKTVTP